jgi:hypothetical protein
MDARADWSNASAGQVTFAARRVFARSCNLAECPNDGGAWQFSGHFVYMFRPETSGTLTLSAEVAGQPGLSFPRSPDLPAFTVSVLGPNLSERQDVFFPQTGTFSWTVTASVGAIYTLLIAPQSAFGNGSTLLPVGSEDNAVTGTFKWAIDAGSRCDSANPITVPIPGGFVCGAANANQFLATVARDQRGSELNLFCTDRREFDLTYVPSAGPARQVGRCPWSGGINYGFVTYANVDGDIKPDCFIETLWRSVEPGITSEIGDQGVPILIDSKAFEFKPPSDNLRMWHDVSLDGPGGFFVDIQIKEATNIDPLLFNPHPQNPGVPPMVTTVVAPCDLDLDGDCDSTDESLFLRSLGACVGSDNFNSLADANLDRCVTVDDQRRLFTGTIDIRPGSYPNNIGVGSNGLIPVVILTTQVFDAAAVDPLSAQFGPAGATEAHGRGHLEDVDHDGDMDLVLHFRRADAAIQCDATYALLSASTSTGQKITAFDSVRTEGCR